MPVRLLITREDSSAWLELIYTTPDGEPRHRIIRVENILEVSGGDRFTTVRVLNDEFFLENITLAEIKAALGLYHTSGTPAGV